MGYSRAVRVGQHVFVAGTAPVMPEGAGAARRRLRSGDALPRDHRRCAREAGAGPEHVVRTRIFATSADDFEEIARAHGEVFGDVARQPRTCVTKLLDPRWRVEIEAEALIA